MNVNMGCGRCARSGFRSSNLLTRTCGHTQNIQGTELQIFRPRTDSKIVPEPLQEINKRGARLSQFWREKVSLLVEPGVRRDHLANERTFLSWLRTSLAFSMTGIFTTQLFILQSPRLPHMNLGFFVLGVPLGSLCQAAALVNSIIGAYRFWRLQNALVSGKACTGGWEIVFIGALTALVSAGQ